MLNACVHTVIFVPFFLIHLSQIYLIKPHDNLMSCIYQINLFNVLPTLDIEYEEKSSLPSQSFKKKNSVLPPIPTHVTAPKCQFVFK